MNIKTEVSRCNPWLKKINGTHPVYHLEGEFLDQTKRISSKYAIYTITEPGIYQGPKIGKGQLVVAGRRIDSGLISIAEDGTATEITTEEAMAAMRAAGN